MKKNFKMKELWNKLQQIKYIDKVQHFVACFIVTLTVSFYNDWLAVGLATGLGIGKEVGDYFNPNSKFSIGDLVADGLGIGTGVLIKLGLNL